MKDMSAFRVDSARFGDLASRALREWPEPWEATKRVVSDNGLYEIVGLWELFDSRCAAYDGTRDYLLMLILHASIFELLHCVANDVTLLRPTELRIEVLEEIFVRRMRVSGSDDTARAEDVDEVLRRVGA